MKAFKKWFYSWSMGKFLDLEAGETLIGSSNKSNLPVENPRDAATRKRVKKAFEAQEKLMEARVQKAHDASCLDPLDCKKIVCYSFTPDKIVSSQEISIKPGKEFKKSQLPDQKKVEQAIDKEIKKRLERDKITE